MRYAFPWLLCFLASGAVPAGSEACGACHAAIYQSFMRTPMAHSSGLARPADLALSFDQAQFQDNTKSFSYRAAGNSSSYFFDFLQLAGIERASGRRVLDYFVGSGSAARSFLLNDGGFLFEAPVAYYRSSKSWKPAPGYADRNFPYLNRPIQQGCLQCHASGIRHIEGTQNAYESPPFREGGVACERCHGPGSEHIASGKAMVNPAKLPAAERDSVCEQCHLSGEIRVPKQAKEDQELTPGEKRSDLFTVFVRAGSSSQLRVTSHAENFAQSACKRASGEKMWCATCHDPHIVPTEAEKPAYYRAKCLTCHEVSSCRASQASRQATGDNCIQCHMPRNPVSDVEHVVFTNHSIPRRPTTSGPAAAVDAELLAWDGGNIGKGDPRDLALAYAMVGRREGIPQYVERAFRLMQQEANDSKADLLTLAYLAEFYRDRKDDARALPLYRKVWEMDRTQFAAAAALGAYAMQQRDYDEAIRYWDQALAISPGLVLVRLNLAAALVQKGQASRARAVLEKALEFQPTFQEARDMLDRLGSVH